MTKARFSSLEVVIPSKNGLWWVPLLVKYHRQVGLVPRYFVDDTSTPAYRAVARLFLASETMHHIGDRAELMLENIVARTKAPWVFRIDDDEAPSQQLVQWLMTHLDEIEGTVLAVPRQAVMVSGKLAFQANSLWTEPTWSRQDYQFRVFRRLGAEYDTNIHTPGIKVDHSRAVLLPDECCLYHFDWVVRTAAERRLKLSGYERQSDGAGTNPQYLRQFLFEDHDIETYDFSIVEDLTIQRLARRLDAARRLRLFVRGNR